MYKKLLGRFKHQKRGDIIAGEVGAGARGVAVGKNIIQIGNLVIPVRLLLTLLFPLIPILTALFWSRPTEMTGSFNVAVAEFGQISPMGQVEPSASGQRLSEWIFKTLRDEYKSLPTVQIWHDNLDLTDKRVTIGLMRGNTPEERSKAAAALAQKINAHVVIYGNLDSNYNSAGFIPEFYVANRANS